MVRESWPLAQVVSEAPVVSNCSKAIVEKLPPTASSTLTKAKVVADAGDHYRKPTTRGEEAGMVEAGVAARAFPTRHKLTIPGVGS